MIRFVARRFYRAPDRQAVRLLDLGCGTGANLWYLAREGFDAFGIDGSAVALERAHRRLEQEGLQAHLHQGDILQLPYDSNSFDGVIDCECIYANSSADSRRILHEVERVLKPGAAFLSITFMPGTHGGHSSPASPGQPHGSAQAGLPGRDPDVGMIRVATEGEIKELYGAFEFVSLDHLIRSEQNRLYEIREWLVECRKRLSPNPAPPR